MDITSSLLVAFFLMAVSAGLTVWHFKSWHAAQAEPLDRGERAFRWRQFRHRTQTSGMLGMVGVAIFLGTVLTPWIASPLFTLMYWGAVLLLLLWLVLLALADMLASRFHFSRMHNQYVIDQAKLRAEARKLQGAEGNGKGNARSPLQDPPGGCPGEG
jgi:UDP-N-acetylmuramyl pentapeptide phosphotransferase/UDP-N-acetylglucosamine-1-phosphate transferase